VLEQVARLCRSPGLRRSRQLQSLLRYVVKRSLQEKHQVLKEYTLGVEVFGRPADYDPRLDPIVRVQARNLRQRLRHYYESEGAEDRVQVELPEGSYVPRITYQRRVGSPWKASTLAILPFVNINGDAERGYLARGLSDALITELAQVKELRVLARASSFQFQRRPVDLDAVLSALGATYIVDGAVEESSEDIRATVELWSKGGRHNALTDTFVVGSDEIASLATTIAKAVLEAVDVASPEASAAGRPRVSTHNARSYHACLQGWEAFHRWSDDQLLEAADWFRQAIALDSANAIAYAGLSLSWWALGNNGVKDGSEAQAEARATAEKAISIDPSIGQAHCALGSVAAGYEWRWAEGEQSLREGIRLSPSFGLGRHALAQVVLLPQRRFDEAFREMDTARDLDPLSVHLAAEYGFSLYLAARYEEAHDLLSATLRLHPRLWFVYEYRAWVYYGLGRHEEAWSDAQRASDLNPGDETTAMAAFMAARTDSNAARELVSKLSTDSAFFFQALPLMAHGPSDQVYDLLEQSYRKKEPMLRYASVGFGWEPLWGDEGFDQLRRSIGLPDPLQAPSSKV